MSDLKYSENLHTAILELEDLESAVYNFNVKGRDKLLKYVAKHNNVSIKELKTAYDLRAKTLKRMLPQPELTSIQTVRWGCSG